MPGLSSPPRSLHLSVLREMRRLGSEEDTASEESSEFENRDRLRLAGRMGAQHDPLRLAGLTSVVAMAFVPKGKRDDRRRDRDALQRVRNQSRESFWSLGWSKEAPLPAGRGLPPARAKPGALGSSLQAARSRSSVGDDDDEGDYVSRHAAEPRHSGTEWTSDALRKRNRFSLALASAERRRSPLFATV